VLIPQVALPFALRWGFSTRLDPAEQLPRPELKQVHGCDIHRAGGEVRPGDGLWTTQPRQAIGVRVADCVPILLAGRIQGEPWIAALHAGWRGATDGILRRGIGLFAEHGGDPGDLAWAFGPAIQPCHFEVGDEVLEAARRDPAWREDLARPGPRGRPHLDLHGLLRAQALELGLDPERDGSVPLCTVCQEDLLYSYRRGDLEGRQWGWIEIL
jgi:YfiH family protein